jgi:hypothetical protein
MEEDPNIIRIDAYNDRAVGEGIRIRGFQSYFKKIRKKEKVLCYLPINGYSTTGQAWENFYNQNRAARTDGERGTRLTIYAYYQFVKKEPNNKSDNIYYYAIPKGFTQSDLVNAENDFSFLIARDNNTVYNFQVQTKLSKKVGLCTLTERK